jgi:ribosome-associated toxin RatA of RatAB toxin-antitoxin module
MPKVSVSAQAPAEADKVWQLATDLPRYAEWNSMHEGFSGDVPEALGEGTTYKQRVKLMGMPAEIAWKVTAVEAPGRLELKGDGPMGVKAINRWVIDPSPEGSQITIEMEFKSLALAGPMGATVEKQVEAALQTSLAKFTALLG